MGLADVKVPVFVNPHRSSVRVPAGMSEQEVLVPRQHLKMMTEISNETIVRHVQQLCSLTNIGLVR